MTDQDLLALNILEEAGGEPDDGKAAVARIVKNRMARKFFSDGTIRGTVLAPDQFSWAWFHFVTKTTGNINPAKHIQVYVRAAKNLAEATIIAEKLLATAPRKAMAHCRDIAAQVMAGTYEGPAYSSMTDLAVSYINPKILTRLPSWATPVRLVCVIGQHHFYRADDPPVAQV